ncbi:TetR/AcrR family transcriptional regulator [Haliangium ochraceum]|uniref:Transcriptional regulator, TetR family n=1 Tax=Haliangium ochraceum (strain DSM 14365 / JCM 11303 / SMP-2) TaxID=502025 RepID=D0LSM2_HALO1|nr:TetR/AcrR family transcriptional regulator [Haliangium ochraceum]ACY17244.1 transcriptional regulator, TetR family [Haliangium ochraceum DSM 14365]
MPPKKQHSAPAEESARPGRPRDPTRDEAILDATLEVLADLGAAGLTMELVAARAKAGKATIYRRWSSKTELVIDAIAHMKRGQVDLERLPETGTLRGDLLALFKPQTMAEAERRLALMAGLAALLSQDQSLAEAGNAAVVEPWAEAHYRLMQRALERGEFSPAADIATLSQVIPAIAAYRAMVLRQPFELDFLIAMVDGVILPAMRSPSPSSSPRS